MQEPNSSLTDQIDELVQQEDLGGLDRLIQSLDTAQLQQYKTELKEGCLSVYYLWLYYVQYDKVRKEDQELVIADLFDALLAIEKVDPHDIQFVLRGGLHEQLADLKTAPEEKLFHMQNAIDEYRRGLHFQPSANLYAVLAEALLNKMTITQQFTEAGLKEALQLFQQSLTTQAKLFTVFLHGSFKVLAFPFSDNQHWHKLFLQQLEALLTGFAAADPLVYLEWSNELVRVLEMTSIYAVSSSYAAQINNKSIALLSALKDHETNDQELLNQLGSAFDKAARGMESHAITQQLDYYKVALNYFLQGHAINPAAWTFTVYATNVQIAMAQLYYRQHRQAEIIALFEAGNTTFTTTYGYDQGFTLTLYWGNFLIEYARLAYDFNAPAILKDAESKLLSAKEQGEGYYSQPFISLAKAALKMGDRQRCLDILRECKSVFTTEYYQYDFTEVLEDEDFKEIWNAVDRLNHQ
jgi:hypothetical protein